MRLQRFSPCAHTYLWASDRLPRRGAAHGISRHICLLFVRKLVSFYGKARGTRFVEPPGATMLSHRWLNEAYQTTPTCHPQTSLARPSGHLSGT